MINKQTIHSALLVLAVVGIVAAVQAHVVKVPLIGDYLPGGARM
jgi:hypothetical protein